MFPRSQKRSHAGSDERPMHNVFMPQIPATNQGSPHAGLDSHEIHEPFVFQSNLLGANRQVSHANFDNDANQRSFAMESMPRENQEPWHANLDNDADHESVAMHRNLSDGGNSPAESMGGSIRESDVSSIDLQEDACSSPAFEERGENPVPNDAAQLGDKAARSPVACIRCREEKSQCSGKRPTCDACSNTNKQCTWAVPEGQPTTQKRKSKMRMKGPALESQSFTTKLSLQVRSACTRCQKRKAKCSGERPSCQYCTDRDFECVYDVADGATRTEDLKRKVSEALAKSQDLSQLVEAMRSLPILDSTALLARLRLGDPIEDIFASVRAALSPANSVQ